MRQMALALSTGIKCMLALLLLLGAGVASAADITVNVKCGFVSAIKSANEDRARGGCPAGDGHDKIILTRDVDPGGELRTIDTDITLVGNNHRYKVNRGDVAFNVKRGGNLTVENLRIQYKRLRPRKIIEVRDSTLTLRDVRANNCSVGVEQSNGKVTIAGVWDICGLSDGDLVSGKGKVDIQRPVIRTCAGISGITVSAPGGLDTGVQCRALEARGVGNAEVIEAGLLAAVDVWSAVEPGTQVCFDRVGAALFLDANTSPRAVSSLESTLTPGGTCVGLPGAGTVALVVGQPTHDATAPPQPPEPPQPAVCTIITTGHLKLRARPSLSGEVLAYVLRGTDLTRVARQNNWHQVSYMDATGWLGGRYVKEVSGCG